MREAQCGERMDREGGRSTRVFFIATTAAWTASTCTNYSGGNSVVVYGQTELTRDLY